MSEAVQKELPKKWEWSTLGEVCEKPQYGWTTKASQEGGLHLLRTTDITSGQINWDTVPYCVIEPEDKEKYRISNGDIVVSRAGSVGVSYLITNPEPSVFASYLIRFKPLIDRKYVYYFLKSPAYWNAISEKSSGIALQNVNASKLKEIDIPVAPLEQQKRIVAKIEELFSHIDAGIDALKKAKQLLKQYRQSVLKAAVTGELTKDWREANKGKLEPASQLLERILKKRRQKWEELQLEQFKAKGKIPKDDKWNEKYKEPDPLEKVPEEVLPDTWQWVAIGQVFEVYVGATPSRKKPEYWGDEINWVSSGEVAFCHIKNTKEKITTEGLNNTSTVVHPPGTVMLGMIGEGKTRGQSAILDIYAAHNQNTAAIEKYFEEQSTEYLYFYLMQQYELTRKRGSGNNQKALNKTRVQSIEFPLAPLDEQKVIATLLIEKFSLINRLENEIDLQFVKSEKNKQSILSTAFNGDLNG